MTFADGSVAFTSVKIGDQVWMSKNLAIDDDGEGIYYNPKNKEYYYTWAAAVRIAKAIPGWHLPSVDEWDEACEECGGVKTESDDYEECSLKQKLKIKPSGRYKDNFNYVDSYSYFWSASEVSKHCACCRVFNTDSVGRYSIIKARGYSVRLVKDK